MPHDATSLWCKFRHTDLAAAYPILARLYVADQGRPARPPDDMLRAWLLMLECHITSVKVWLQRLQEQPFAKWRDQLVFELNGEEIYLTPVSTTSFACIK